MNRAFFPVRKTRDRSVLLLPVQEQPAETPRPESKPASLINSWYFLIPLGLMCIGVYVARSLGYIQ